MSTHMLSSNTHGQRSQSSVISSTNYLLSIDRNCRRDCQCCIARSELLCRKVPFAGRLSSKSAFSETPQGNGFR